MRAGSHLLDADEPGELGGGDRGPGPYDLLLMSLGACTSMTLRVYAKRKGYSLHDVQAVLRHERLHAQDCTECDGRSGRVERVGADPNLSHRADRILSQGWGPAFRGPAVDKCRSVLAL
jgi:organic hydroperoxide reductase OsmC/OhrA